MANGNNTPAGQQDPFAALGAVAAPAPQSTPAPVQEDPFKALGAVPAPAPTQSQQSKPQDTGVLAGIKRNTVDAITGLYHAFTDPATEQEKADLRDKFNEEQARTGIKVPETYYTDPPRATLALHRILDAPADVLLKKGKDESAVAKDLINNHEYWRGGNMYLSSLADRGLGHVPLVGPAINAIAERGEGALVGNYVDEHGNPVPLSQVPESKKDFSGAATDIAAALAPEVAVPVAGKIAAKVGEGLEKVAPESMNALLRANKQANYLYGKNPGQAFIDEQIKIPKNSVTMAGQLENLHGQLETAGDNLSQKLDAALNEPSVASKKIDIVPDIRQAISDAKKSISKQAGLDVPKYTQELDKLEDSILTRYDQNGNPTGKITQTKLSPAEVADVKRSLGKNTQWNVLPTDPEIQLKQYLNGIRKKIYGQLADKVEAAAPNTDVKDLNHRLSNVIEAQGLLEKRIALEHGTGGYNAALRKAEFWGGLASALFSPEPVTKTGGAALVADRVIRSVPGKMATAKGLNAAGESLQSGVGHAVAKAAGVAPAVGPAVEPSEQNEQ